MDPVSAVAGLGTKICPTCGKRLPGDAVFCPSDGTPLGAVAATPMSPQGPDPYLGTEISGHIEIQELAGVGAMGRVYRAFQKGIDRHVAVKILHRELSTNSQLVTRFHREAKVASRLQHPNVVQVHLAGQLPDGAMYMVMEYLDGASLSAALAAAGGAMPLPRALHVALQLCDAVGEAHASGVVHRDLKPENVMVVRRGEDPDFVKVLDFGIAKLSSADQSIATAAGLIFGTARYISPEAAQGQQVGPTGDVYAIATITYQLLAGRTPFEGDQAVGILVQQIHDAPPPLRSLTRAAHVPEGIAAIIMAGLAKAPKDRPQDARAFGRALFEAARAAGLTAEELGRVGLSTPGYTQPPSLLSSPGITPSPGLVSSPGLAPRANGSVPPAAPSGPSMSGSSMSGSSMSGAELVARASRSSVDATIDDVSLLSASSLPSPTPGLVGRTGAPSSPPLSGPSPALPDSAAVARFVGGPAAANAASPAPSSPGFAPTFGTHPSSGMTPSGVSSPGGSLPGGSVSGGSVTGGAPVTSTVVPASVQFPDAGLPVTDPGLGRSHGQGFGPGPTHAPAHIPAGPAPRAPRRPFLLWAALGIALAIVGVGATRALSGGSERAAGIDLEGIVTRGDEALRQRRWDAPPGDNVRDLTAEGLARWPDDARLRGLRTRAAKDVVSAAVEQQAVGELAEALRLARLATELDPEDRTAARLLEKLQSASDEADKVAPLGEAAPGGVEPMAGGGVVGGPVPAPAPTRGAVTKPAPQKSAAPGASAPVPSAAPTATGSPASSAKPKPPPAPSASAGPKWM